MGENLTLELETFNVDNTPMLVTKGLHPYWAVSNRRAVTVRGLYGRRYCFAAASPLWKKVNRGHGGAKLSKDERATLALWMDLNVTEFTVGGGYSWNRPESRETDPAGEARLRAAVKEALGDKVAAQPFDALVNRGMEERSRVLWLVKPEDRARFLLLVKASLKPKPAHDIQGTCGRDDACECNSCWIRRGGYNKPK